MFLLKDIKISCRGKVIAEKVEIANTFGARLKGLLGRKKLSEGEGMLLYPCSSIHCIGMKFTIDAIFMNEDKKVIGIRPNLKPGSKATVYGAQYVLEVGAGVIKEQNILLGNILEWEETST